MAHNVIVGPLTIDESPRMFPGSRDGSANVLATLALAALLLPNGRPYFCPANGDGNFCLLALSCQYMSVSSIVPLLHDAKANISGSFQ